MLEVKVKGPAVKLQGQWKFKGETEIITQEEYRENEEYLQVIKGEIKQNKANVQPQTPKTEDDDDKELLVLREKAKDLGIKGAHNMKKENLIAKIEEVEKANSIEDENEESDEGDETEKGQPQE